MGDANLVEDDGPLNMAQTVDNSLLENKRNLTIINTNARLLCPKIDSLVECFEELKVDISIVTETWFKRGQELDQRLSDLEHGFGLCALTKNRPPNPSTGVAHGGVAIIYKKKIGTFKLIDLPNPENYEILSAVGTLMGTARKLVVIAAYLPPNYTVPKGTACL